MPVRKQILAVTVVAAALLSVVGAAQAPASRGLPAVIKPDAGLKITCDGPINQQGDSLTVVAGPIQLLACSVTGGTEPFTWTHKLISPGPSVRPLYLPYVRWFRLPPPYWRRLYIGGSFRYLRGGYVYKVTASDKTATTSIDLSFKTVLPTATDILGVGSGTTENLFDQFSNVYNTQVGATVSDVYGFDATNPYSGAVGDPIVTKSGCKSIARPDGSSAGITTLDENVKDGTTGNYCEDFARSARGRESTDPPYAAGGIAFVRLATDAVTYATRDAASGGTNAPANLTTSQLAAIYTCADTNWDQVGGKKGSIEAFLPSAGSETAASFLTDIGVTTPGSCINTTPPENEGVDSALNSADAILPYSVADYIAQAYHSPACFNSACTADSTYDGAVCIAISGGERSGESGQNQFGCDETGVLGLNKINGVAPATPWPLTSTSKNPAINPSFPFLIPVYDVVRYDPNTTDHIPGPESGAPGGINLEAIFGASGWACTNATAIKDIKDYGYLTTDQCGTTS
jgi:ABC-type phosphate transport system substrate-binding protein